MKILGISAFYHDSAAALVVDGKIIAASQEERFTRKKHDNNFPTNAINFVLKFANIKISDLDVIVFYEKPLLKFHRLIKTYLNYSPKGFRSFNEAMKTWLNVKIFQKKYIFEIFKSQDKKFNDINKIFFSEHHLSHAASAFYPSPFEEAVVLTADDPNRQAGIIDTEAEVLWKMGRFDEAIEAIERALAIDPKSQYYKNQKEKFIESRKAASQSA